MSELKPQQLQALRDALSVAEGPPPVTAITARGTALRRRRRAIASLASAGVVAVAVVGVALVSGPGHPATLGVTGPVTSSTVPSPTPTSSPVPGPSPTTSPPVSIAPLPFLKNAPCPPSSSPVPQDGDLIDATDHRNTAQAAAFNHSAVSEAHVLQGVAASVHDHGFGVAQADGAHDDLIIWRTGGAAGASQTYATVAAKVGIPVVFRVAVLSAGQIEQTSHDLLNATREFREAGVNLNSTTDDGHNAVTVGVDPLNDAARRIALAHAPYGPTSIVLTCEGDVAVPAAASVVPD